MTRMLRSLAFTVLTTLLVSSALAQNGTQNVRQHGTDNQFERGADGRIVATADFVKQLVNDKVKVLPVQHMSEIGSCGCGNPICDGNCGAVAPVAPGPHGNGGFSMPLGFDMAQAECDCNKPSCPKCNLRRATRPVKGLCSGPECGCKKTITGVDSATCTKCGEADWGMRGPIPWEAFAQGEYIGPPRARHVGVYRLRVDDQLELIYRITRDRSAQAYELNVGDEVRVEAVADETLDRELIVQPDGTITARLLGQVLAAGRTTEELRMDLEQRYKKFYRKPSVTVTPLKVNTKLEDLRATVDSRQGFGGQNRAATVSPDGTIQLPAVGPIPAHGLTLEELKAEIDARYAAVVDGIEVTPVLTQRAPRFIYVMGEVGQAGRFDLVGPTTVTQALALAQGWNVGANLRSIVVFRRAEDWRLLATKIDLQGALYGRRPAPSDEIWLRDSDVVIVPKSPIRVIDDAIDLLFTQGIYSIAPFVADPVIFTDASQL